MSGAKDVINRILAAKPDEIVQFSDTTHDSNNSGVNINGTDYWTPYYAR